MSENTVDVLFHDEWQTDTISGDTQKFPELLFDTTEDRMVKVSVWQHEVGHNINVVDSRKQVERRLYRRRGEELRELCRGFNRNNNVTGPVEQSKRRHSGGSSEWKAVRKKGLLSRNCISNKHQLQQISVYFSSLLLTYLVSLSWVTCFSMCVGE